MNALKTSKKRSSIHRFLTLFVTPFVVIGLAIRNQHMLVGQASAAVSTRSFAQGTATGAPQTYLDCSTIDKVTIVKELGRGKQKSVFEVILPTGQHVAAKRCSHRSCEQQKLVAHEERFFRSLHEAFPESSLEYFGFCSFPYNAPRDGKLNARKLDEASTLFVELGTPALANWDQFSDYTPPTSKEDLDALRDIARQYDAFPGGPLRLHGDNKYPHQYMRNQRGRLVHIDFDMVDQMPPPITSTLDENCNILLSQFAGLSPQDPRLNCTVAYQQPEDYQPHPQPTTAITRAQTNSTTSARSTTPDFLISPLPSNMALIHIGKTAGSTISGNLKHGCHMFVKHPCAFPYGSNNYRDLGTKGGPGEESQISKLTLGYYHFNPVPTKQHDGYILSARNPIDRMISAFIYVHPLNVQKTTTHRYRFLTRNKRTGQNSEIIADYEQFFECFPTVQALAEGLKGTNDCANFGRYVLSGNSTRLQKSEMLNHFAFGYQYYAAELLRDKSRIFALRQEYLDTDWIQMNLRLGGAFHEIGGNSKNFQGQLAVTKPSPALTSQEMQGICAAMAEEIRIWWAVIHLADNLTDEEKEQSKKEIQDQCGENVV